MSWMVILKNKVMDEIEQAINNGIHNESDYTTENADTFQRFLRRKYNDNNIVVEYIEDDEAFYIDINGVAYKFDIDGRFTKTN
tara:strand:+ start:4774 stop:5022 length:249 start_codon:yes stop_codon:yes gene_type:complete